MRTHMSSPWYQYSYWAERIWACKRPMPARTFVPFDKRSLINFQQRSMCWVPHFTFTVFPPGNLWTFILTKFGLVHSHFPFFLTRFFLVDNRIMKNARELHLARLGRVSVENHRAVGQPFLAQRPPILFCDGAGAWRPGSCQCWAESGKH